ncbi:hypothetical protein [Jatrophihabitans sp.]|jgi:hypothetical protein|uniref:hypothetical protein n=1 Tax=Jatrophihabitans sp. TaxID=1932789 RepID=UPI002F09B202
MTVNLESSTVEVHLCTPIGDQPLGRFAINAGRVEGTDHRGINYRGTCTPVLDGVNVELTAQIPAGTRAGTSLTTEAASEQRLAFFLNADQVAGRQTKSILLVGFGLADVRFATA